MQFRPVFLATGVMTALLGAAMIPCALIDIADGTDNWPIFAQSAFFSILLGLTLAVLSRGGERETGQREAFFLTVLVWVALPAVAAVPFIAGGATFTDAIFESVSGLTTTGATVFTGLAPEPGQRGTLLWRAILQWIGGIGIIVTAIAILPGLRVGGMQLFQIESSDQSGKFLPRVTEIAAQTGLVYLVLSVACALLYSASDMDPFDAIAHAMTTVSAGGYATRDSSFADFSAGAQSVAIVFMILASLPFAAFVLMVRGQALALVRDPQPRLLIGLVSAACLILLIYNGLGSGGAVFDDAWHAVRGTLFNVVSIITGTGYASENYAAWGPGAAALFLILMFLGGCAGSAACGIKMFRLEISFRAAVAHAQRMTSPSRLAPVRYRGKVVDEDTLQSVMVFVFLYLTTFLVTAALLSLTGADTATAISGAAASVSNVGPGLGSVIGPVGTYQALEPAAKWICAIAMLLGRLEFVAVFVVLAPRFWRG